MRFLQKSSAMVKQYISNLAEYKTNIENILEEEIKSLKTVSEHSVRESKMGLARVRSRWDVKGSFSGKKKDEGRISGGYTIEHVQLVSSKKLLQRQASLNKDKHA